MNHAYLYSPKIPAQQIDDLWNYYSGLLQAGCHFCHWSNPDYSSFEFIHHFLGSFCVPSL